jgi:hypothetical protein
MAMMIKIRKMATFGVFVIMTLAALQGARAHVGSFPPCAALVAAAQARHIPLQQVDPPAGTDDLNPGDSITALVTQFEKGGRRNQWVIYLQALSGEHALQAPKAPNSKVMFTCFGHKLTFTSSPWPVTVRTVGPFIDSGPGRRSLMAEDKTAHFDLDQGFLGIGLNKAAAGWYRVHQLNKTGKSDWVFDSDAEPFTPAQIAEGRKMAALYHVTPDEERAWTGVEAALISYFNIIHETPGLSHILFKIIDRPSIWSVLRHGGVNLSINLQSEKVEPVDGLKWGLKTGESDHLVLDVSMIVTAPRPPLLICGGVVGLIAQNPKDKQNSLTLRVISARRKLGASDTAATTPWKQIVMVGASVTAGFTMSEPLGGPWTAHCDLSRYLGATLAVPHQPVLNLGNTLFFMQPELIGKRQLESALKANPTLVTGIDFLFWFCYGRVAHEYERARRFEEGLKLLETVPCPIIVGDIPDASAAVGSMLSPDQIPTLSAMSAANRRLKEWAATRPQVAVVPLSKLMQTIAAGKPVAIHGQTWPSDPTRPLLQPDQLHPTPRGCAILALAMLNAFESSRQGTSIDEIRWDPNEVFRLVSKQIP